MYNSSNYVENAVNTESRDFEAIKSRVNVDDRIIRLLHASMGMNTESAEFIDALKKHIFYGKQLDLINLKEELGDVLWYVAIAADTLEIDLNDIMTKNIEKLKARYPNKFSEENAINRNLDKEHKILES